MTDKNQHSQPVPRPEPHSLSDQSRRAKRIIHKTSPETPLSLLEELRKQSQEGNSSSDG